MIVSAERRSPVAPQAQRGLRRGGGAGGKAHKAWREKLGGFRVRSLGQLLRWGGLMAAAGLLLVVLLESTKGAIRVEDLDAYLRVSGRTPLCGVCQSSDLIFAPWFWNHSCQANMKFAKLQAGLLLAVLLMSTCSSSCCK